MDHVTASAPGKLMLFGEHAVVYGYPCIVTAVNQRISASVRKNGVDIFHLEAPDLGLSAYSKTISDLGKKHLPKGVRFIEHLYKRFLERYPQKKGVIVTTKSEFSSSFGFGSSSAVTVAFAKALVTLYEIDLTNEELFDFCYQAVLDVQGVGSGFDLAAAIWGGTIYYEKPAALVDLLRVKELPIVVGYTGVKADTPTLIRLVETLKTEKPEQVDDLFQKITSVVTQAKTAIKNSDWQKAGELMTDSQQLLTKLHISSPELEKLINASIAAGGHGAKLSGAGGGDCMVVVVAQDKRIAVEKAITKAGGEVMQVELNAEGVRTET